MWPGLPGYTRGLVRCDAAILSLVAWVCGILIPLRRWFPFRLALDFKMSNVTFRWIDPEYGTLACALIGQDYDAIKAGAIAIVGGEEYVTRLQMLAVPIDYPLTNPTTVRITTDDLRGFTKRSFYLKVAEAYQRIYEEEGPAPEPEGMLLNRPETAGKYGIYGHELGDLVLVGASIAKSGAVELHVES